MLKQNQLLRQFAPVVNSSTASKKQQLCPKKYCTMYYSCCGDINLFTQSRCGDSLPLWGQNSSPHNVNHCILV